MDESKSAFNHKKFLRLLREKGKSFAELKTSISLLQDEASTKGLDDAAITAIMEIVMNVDLGAINSSSLIKCMIPRGKVNDDEVKSFISWFFSMSAPVTTLATLLQWFIGCWEYHLIERNSIYIFYDCFFFLMLKQEKLESRLAQLIYLMTKPEDVTRRQVTRLMKLIVSYRKPPRHITALQSLFKSYKPEFVPEKIPAINVQSTWRPITEILRLGFEDARDRLILKEAQRNNQLSYDWKIFNVPQSKKNQEPLVPSVGYFNIGSSIFNDKKEKSIFDVPNIEKLAQYHSVIKLPCNATSLLTNAIGYHLLTFADIEYQQRFIHNLYYTLWRSFVFENGRYSEQEMDKILDMTVEFCKYMQHGISIVSYFINEYLSCYVEKHHLKLFSLMEWSSVSISELQDYVLKHMKVIFYSSSISVKCNIIRTLRMLISNLTIINDNAFRDKLFPFLDQSFSGRLKETAEIVEDFTKELIMSGLNIHFYDSCLMFECLSFYEQVNAIEIYRKASYISLPPSALIYGCFVTKSCALLSRVCGLLLQYRRYIREHKDEVSSKNITRLIVYAEDFVSALWYDNSFSNRLGKNRYFLRCLTEDTLKINSNCDVNSLLNISQHYAVLPYIYSLDRNGVDIKTKKDALRIAAIYYSQVNQFIAALLGNNM